MPPRACVWVRPRPLIARRPTPARSGVTQVVAKFWCGRVVKGKVLAVDHEDSNIHVTRATGSNADKLKEGSRATLLCSLNTNAKTEVAPARRAPPPLAPLPSRPRRPRRAPCAWSHHPPACFVLRCRDPGEPGQVWTAVARFCIGREESALIMLVVPLGESVKLKVCLESPPLSVRVRAWAPHPVRVSFRPPSLRPPPSRARSVLRLHVLRR